MRDALLARDPALYGALSVLMVRMDYIGRKTGPSIQDPIRSFPPLWPFLATYTAWALYVDKSPEHGGRFNPWIRSSRFFKYFAEYYPAS